LFRLLENLHIVPRKFRRVLRKGYSQKKPDGQATASNHVEIEAVEMVDVGTQTEIQNENSIDVGTQADFLQPPVVEIAVQTDTPSEQVMTTWILMFVRVKMMKNFIH